jgi:hypothetical protein
MNRNKGKPRICRIVSLNKFGGVIIGRDMGEIFKEGHVYSVSEIMGEFLIKDLGEHAVPNCLGSRGTISQYLHSGVTMLTKQEYEIEKKSRDNVDNEEDM